MQRNLITPLAAVLLVQYASAFSIEQELGSGLDAMQLGQIADALSHEELQLAQVQASSDDGSSDFGPCANAAKRAKRQATKMCRKKHGRRRGGKGRSKELIECLDNVELDFEEAVISDCSLEEPDEPDDDDNDDDDDGDDDLDEESDEEEKVESPDAADLQKFNDIELVIHNMWRGYHNAPALVQDAGLTADAQAYAEQLWTKADGVDHPSPGAGVDYGECIIEGPGLGWLFRGQASVTWYQEYMDYDYCDPEGEQLTADKRPPYDCFTQMVWKGTTSMGCGYADATFGDFMVCRYTPAGNVSGEYADNVERPSWYTDKQRECDDIDDF